MIAFKFFGNCLDHAVKERIQNASHYNSHCVLGIYIDSQNAGAAFCDISTGKTFFRLA